MTRILSHNAPRRADAPVSSRGPSQPAQTHTQPAGQASRSGNAAATDAGRPDAGGGLKDRFGPTTQARQRAELMGTALLHTSRQEVPQAPNGLRQLVQNNARSHAMQAAMTRAKAGDANRGEGIREATPRPGAWGPDTAPNDVPERATHAPQFASMDEVEDLGKDKVEAKQAAFRSQMEAAGVEASDPPTDKELKAYFRTFQGRDGSEAVKAYEQYSDAYTVHIGDNQTYGSKDSVYGRDSTVTGKDGTVYNSKAEALKDTSSGDVSKVSYDNPDTLKESMKHTDKKYDVYELDCDGYARQACELLSEAGLECEFVVGTMSDTDDRHSAVIVKSGDKEWVASNGEIEGGDGNNTTLNNLDAAFGKLDSEGGLPTRYYTGDSGDTAAAHEDYEVKDSSLSRHNAKSGGFDLKLK